MRMDFVRSLFFGFPFAVYGAAFAVGPIAGGGALAAWLISGPLARLHRLLVAGALALAEIVASLTLVFVAMDPIGNLPGATSVVQTALFFLVVPVSVYGAACLWVPFACQAVYLVRAKKPRPIAAAGIGVAALVAGTGLVVGMGVLAGAATN